MAYTNTWSVTVPAGSEPANTIDDHFRRLRLDIQERLLEVFVAPLTTDPLVVKDEIRGKVVGKRIVVPFCAFMPDEPFGDAVTYGGTAAGDTPNIEVASTAGPVRAPLIIPGGCTITRIQWLVNNTDTNQVNLKLLAAPFVAGATTQELNAMLKADIGDEIIDSGAISLLVPNPNARMMWLMADKSTGGGSFQIKGVQIVYTTPDSRFTY